jgi:anti-sigma regulatory factor (Ser/Thr protein kinase)
MSGGTGAVWASCGAAVDVSAQEQPASAVGTAFQDWPLVSYLELAALPTAVSCGRLHARQVLWEWRLSQLVVDAETVLSELLTNAVAASWSPAGVGLVAVRLLADPQRLLIEVWDHNPGAPQRCHADSESESGRGLLVVGAIAHRWGYHRVRASLKVVWAELLTGTDSDGR